MHSPEPLSSSEILNVMPTDKSIARLYKNVNEKQKLEKILLILDYTIVWSYLNLIYNTFANWD